MLGTTTSLHASIDQLVSECLAHHIDLHLSSYSRIEADAVFHNVSVEQTVMRYLIAKLREVSALR